MAAKVVVVMMMPVWKAPVSLSLSLALPLENPVRKQNVTVNRVPDEHEEGSHGAKRERNSE